MLLFLLLAILADLIAPFNPTRAFPYAVLHAPGGEFLFGSDGNGMDLLSAHLPRASGMDGDVSIAHPATLRNFKIDLEQVPKYVDMGV